MKSYSISMQTMTLKIATFLTVCLSMLSLNSSVAGESSPATLLAFSATSTELEFTVVSTGCTLKEHFTLDISHSSSIDNSGESQAGDLITITLIRLKRDFCRRMPGPKVISFDLPENIGANVQIEITNKFSRLATRGRR